MSFWTDKIFHPVCLNLHVLTLKAPITTAADHSHEISNLICYFWKSNKIWNCGLLQIIGGALWVNVHKWCRSWWGALVFIHWPINRHPFSGHCYLPNKLISDYSRNLMRFNDWQLYISSKFNVAMRLIVDQSLATGFIPIKTQQQRVSLPFKPGVLERKVYNNDDKTFFSVY